MALDESDVSAPPTLRERIGGRWAVSWQGYLLMLPLAVVFAVTTTAAFLEPGNLLWGVGVSVAAYLATGLVQWVAALTVLRHRRDRPVAVWLVALVGGLSWMARSAVIAGALQSGDFTSRATVMERLAFGLALGVVIDPIVSWSLDNGSRFRARRQQALQELVEAEMSADRQQVYVEAMRVGLVEQVTAAVGKARSRMDSIDLSSDAMPREAVTVLEEASEEAVRRVSRETWQAGEQRSRLRVGDILRTAASGRPFSPWAVAPMAVFGAIVIARGQGWGEALAVAVVASAWLLLVIWVVNTWHPTSVSTGFRFALGIIALAVVGPILAVTSMVIDPDDPLGVGVVMLSSVTPVVLVPLLGMARALDTTEERALETLTTSISGAEVRARALSEQEQRLRRQMAIALHGTVGANLTAATMRLRRAIDDGDITRAKNSLFEARRLLDLDLEAVMTTDAGDVETGLSRLADSWAGLVDVNVQVDGSARALSTRCAAAVIDIVTEAVNNAARHGGARRVDVRVTAVAGADGLGSIDLASIDVEVLDDGQGSDSSREGLGSRVFEHHAPGAWSRERLPGGGCRVRARVAC